ncbi:uncharacterized protein [Nicotiana tomentosiformis]|uniref:uncharacterized protein n=1 Tax=Nicotiana tomentosiformis TaxID=4098 RepID=UPI00388CA066
MARDLVTNTPYQHVLEISWRLEGMQGPEREDMEAKRRRGTGGFSGGHAAAIIHHGRGYVSHPIHSVHQASSGALVIPRAQVAHFAQPHSSASPIRARRMVEKGSNAYPAFVKDVSVDTPTIESVLVVRDFPDVYPVDLLSMPPDRDIDFGIDLLTGTQPISIPPYHMAPSELKDLKEQLQEFYAHVY